MHKKINRTLFIISLLSLFGFTWPTSSTLPTSPAANGTWLQQETRAIEARASTINDKVLRLSLLAYLNARKSGVVGKQQLLTVIDYSKPSSEKRLWVFDLNSGKTLFNTWVAHGKNSGGVNATSFSNNPGSLKSSIGVFVTAEPYEGKNGYSLRLRGLEPGINNYAYERAIVIHGAWYANPGNISKNGIGRSWGCPAVDASLAKPLINTIKDDTVVFAYYPDRNWLSHSRFLA